MTVVVTDSQRKVSTRTTAARPVKLARVALTVEQSTVRSVASPWPPFAIVASVLGWITVVLLLDSDGGRWLQRGLGAITWLLLVGLLARETRLVRVQTAVVVVFATMVEYTFSPLLEVYTYRFDNVPMYVPPGHGLVYLAALAIGRTAFVRAHSRSCTIAALTGVGAYAAYGMLIADRHDVLGAFWFVCLAGFLLFGPSQGLYVGAAVVVTYLEIVGTHLGTWTWQESDPMGIVSIGNPPSGAAGGYGWFDLAALLIAPGLIARWDRRRTGRVSAPASPLGRPADDGR